MSDRIGVRMIARAAAAVALGAMMALPLQAQSASCMDQPLPLQDACQKAADLFAFVAPQLSASLAGGNATLGQTGNLGGVGHFTLGVRATGLRGELPDLSGTGVSIAGPQSETYEVQDQWVALPQVDLALGIFGGVPVGLTSIGGIDLLVSGSWVPEVDGDGVSVRTPEGQFTFGYGARVGLLQETAMAPGVSVTYLRRSLPEVAVDAFVDDDSLLVGDAKLTTDSWRLVAGKNFFAFGLSAGIGQDRYDSHADVAAVVNDIGGPYRTTTPADFSQKLTRTNAFANLAMNLAVLRLVVEVGRVWGDDAPTFNSFAGTSPTEPRLYGSVGLRVGF
ncbi:MAG TPA: hypothetical protein VFS08_18930 [Gemmatimonadaceae bacterium]|nr:hypothetical protein [Gemmatimonadaceae bacterium]